MTWSWNYIAHECWILLAMISTYVTACIISKYPLWNGRIITESNPLNFSSRSMAVINKWYGCQPYLILNSIRQRVKGSAKFLSLNLVSKHFWPCKQQTDLYNCTRNFTFWFTCKSEWKILLWITWDRVMKFITEVKHKINNSLIAAA